MKWNSNKNRRISAIMHIKHFFVKRDTYYIHKCTDIHQPNHTIPYTVFVCVQWILFIAAAAASSTKNGFYFQFGWWARRSGGGLYIYAMLLFVYRYCGSTVVREHFVGYLSAFLSPYVCTFCLYMQSALCCFFFFSFITAFISLPSSS